MRDVAQTSISLIGSKPKVDFQFGNYNIYLFFIRGSQGLLRKCVDRNCEIIFMLASKRSTLASAGSNPNVHEIEAASHRALNFKQYNFYFEIAELGKEQALMHVNLWLLVRI